MSDQECLPLSGSGKSVDDFTSFCEGDIDPTLNKRIRTLIDADKDYLVYLDDELYAEWTFNGDTPDGFEDVANKIGRLETLSITQLLQLQREPFERLLAEAMARILGDKNTAKANEVLGDAEAYLRARGTENARCWYLTGVGVVALGACVLGVVLLLVLSRTSSHVWIDVWEILSACCIGSLGALLFVASRIENITLEPVAGPGIHRFEGGIRVVAGMIGALFIAIAIKSDLLLGIFRSLSHPFLALLVACVIAGATERLVAGLINKMGRSIHSSGA